VTGDCDFDLMALGAFGVPAFQVGVDGSVASCDEHPARFAAPRGAGDDSFEMVCEVENLRARHECSLLSWQVGCEQFVKLSGIGALDKT